MQWGNGLSTLPALADKNVGSSSNKAAQPLAAWIHVAADGGTRWPAARALGRARASLRIQAQNLQTTYTSVGRGVVIAKGGRKLLPRACEQLEQKMLTRTANLKIQSPTGIRYDIMMNLASTRACFCASLGV
jgi:hypothetical protein